MKTEIDMGMLKQDILRVIDAGANRDERDRLEREFRVLFDRASAVPTLIQAKVRYEAALQLLVRDVADYEAWQRPCHALAVARAALAGCTLAAAPGIHCTKCGEDDAR